MQEEKLRKVLVGDEVLDFPTAKLSPLHDKNRTSYLGAGSVSLVKDEFSLKFYQTESLAPDKVFEPLGWTAGELVRPEFYYKLAGTSLSGDSWESQELLPYRSSGSGGTVISGSPRTLILKENREGNILRNELKIYFLGELKIPDGEYVPVDQVSALASKNIRFVQLNQFAACEMSFSLYHDSGWTILSVTSQSVRFTDGLVDSILNAFCFVTAIPQEWSMIYRMIGTDVEVKLHAVKDDGLSSRVRAPIEILKHDTPNDIWMLFDKYLTYLIDSEKEQLPQLMSRLVVSIIEAGKSSLELQALTLCTSIEEFSTRELARYLQADKTAISEIDKIITLIGEEENLSDSIKERAISILGNMKNVRVTDILYALEKNKCLREGLAQIYGNVRNKLAHGGAFDWDHIQDHYNQCAALTVLFYQLVFLKIGYQGVYTDYSSYGYPKECFHTGLASGLTSNR